jgi:hypothetical protein
MWFIERCGSGLLPADAAHEGRALRIGPSVELGEFVIVDEEMS